MYDYGDLCNWRLCPTPTPSSGPTAFNFINIGIEIPGNNVLKGVFDFIYGVNNIINEICNKKINGIWYFCL